ncbi:HesA/MoeB/ThiF family protein [Aspergillus saccharolyticus JOP 1030-1]|uniref:Adenylyltransferase and sulfurtransferase uba4 n=1 Tax=Aspergillus saccharolyticus JOP 1030-1 TaxID=1450539 RepID=A0A318ZQ12_9EURO|nr:Molybdopterin-synthase sulfurtransferase [Aspergillus saccharolyticus JOP 1030-1]PYH49606.1 Molybdopterin-synthase sulfurtransferase [Aspergillus saccharolyticus JOP 1030-1]
MEDIEQTCASLRAQIAATEAQLAGLKRELQIAERAAFDSQSQETRSGSGSSKDDMKEKVRQWPLLAEEYRRYGRQMIVPQLGLRGQLKLRSAKVLIVGAGGLGCPAAVYLAGAGVGTLGLVDGDTVESSNLHRQVLHRSRNVGKLKVDSAIGYLRELNPHPTYIAHREHLAPDAAADVFKDYDLVLDCTDNPATRYLISDTAVLLGKPLVSASALRTEGQLMVLNNPPRPVGDKTGGPCYRCVFPRPPPANTVTSCADGGILGPVVGTMGVLQALEAIKVITADETQAPVPPSLHILSAYSTPLFRSIKLRSRRANCAVCSAEATVNLDTVRSGSTDYVFFCGSADPEMLLRPEERVTPLEYRELHPPTGGTKEGKQPTMIDVREKVQFDICNLENSINIPISTILASSNGSGDAKLPPWVPAELATGESTDPIYVVCRMGNDSQIVVKKLKELGLDREGQRKVVDIQGGFRSWREQIDPEWPNY